MSIWAVARHPRWIGALILALAIACGFAALGQWQLARSFESAAPPEVATETVVPLDAVAQPREPRPVGEAGSTDRVHAGRDR